MSQEQVTITMLAEHFTKLPRAEDLRTLAMIDHMKELAHILYAQSLHGYTSYTIIAAHWAGKEALRRVGELESLGFVVEGLVLDGRDMVRVSW